MPEMTNKFARRDSDGLAVIGRTLNDLRGVRFDEGEGGNAPATPATPAAVPAPPAPAASAAPEPSAAPDVPDWAKNPADAERMVRDLRAEAAKTRTEAKDAIAKAQQELTDKLAVALGLKPDAAADPAALTASLTEAQTKATQAARELAIFKAAAQTGADPSRLLDSNSFMSSVNGLDPNDGAAVTAAITAAIAANPQLKAAQAASASGTELGGTGETGQITEAQLAQMTPEQISKALSEGKLAHLL